MKLMDLEIHADKLGHGLSSTATFASGKPVRLTLDLTDVPDTEVVKFIQEEMLSLAGAIASRWFLRK